LQAWGTKKSMYYSTDYIDEDLGSDFGKSDEEAEEEEKEALRLQKEQAAMFDEVVLWPFFSFFVIGQPFRIFFHSCA
jgi:hypothetical protein